MTTSDLKWTPLNGIVVVRLDDEMKQLPNGLYLPDNVMHDYYFTGTVVSVADHYFLEGEWLTPEVKAGDRVVIGGQKMGPLAKDVTPIGTVIKINGRDYVVTKFTSIWAKLDDLSDRMQETALYEPGELRCLLDPAHKDPSLSREVDPQPAE